MFHRTARALLVLASATSLTACSWVKSTVSGPAEPARMTVPYFEDDFRFWKGTGSASLAGEASFKLDDGRVVTCAGQTVTLMPATQYNMELEQAFGKGAGYPPNYNKQAHVYNRETTCDPTGHFRFEKLPYGVKWIVASRLSWQQAPEESTMASITSVVTDIVTNEAKGGYVYQEVPLHEGLNTVVLSNADFVKDR